MITVGVWYDCASMHAVHRSTDCRVGGPWEQRPGRGLRTVLTLLSAVYLLWITADARTLRRGWKRMPVNSGWAACASSVVR